MSKRGNFIAQRLYTADRCERCGDEHGRLERHHVDGNTDNNDRSNIRILCVKCHMTEDGRRDALMRRSKQMQALGAKARTKWRGLICTVEACDRPAKYRGLCNAHYYRARNNGGAPGATAIRDYRRAQS
jgi:hypothetical protein